MKLKALALACFALVGNASHAALVAYNDSAIFNATYSGLAKEDFQDVASIAQALAGTNITPGVSFSLTSGTDAYLAAANQSANPTTAIGVNFPTTAGWNIDFSTSVDVASFEVFQNIGGGAQSGGMIYAMVDVFGASGLLGGYVVSIPSGTSGFFGVYSDSDLITRLTVNAYNSFDVIDNVSFGRAGAVSAVPEPGSLALLGLGLVGLAASRKRKQA